MKKILLLFTTLLTLLFGFSSCVPDDSFDQMLLTGKWESGTDYYKYNSDGTGITWDSMESSEEDAQAFTWTLVKSELTQIHVLEMGGGGVPKVYTVTKLTETTLVYEDDFKTYTFTKVVE